MIISESQIKKIIRSLIKEQAEIEFFGREFSEFNERVQSGENPIIVAQDMLKKIGEGSTRAVFAFQDNPNIVLKIITWDDKKGVNPETGFKKQQMIDSNRWESDLQMQQKYPEIFPRTFEHAKNFSWIISERVDRVKNYESLFEIMGLSDEKFSTLPSIKKIQFQALIELGISYYQDPGGAAKQMLSENEDLNTAFELAPTKTQLIPADVDKEIPEEDKQLSSMARRLKKLLSNRQSSKILAAMGDLEIPAVEFSPKNLGLSPITGKLILLDASLWKDYRPVKENKKIKITHSQLRSIILEKVNLLEAYDVGDGVNLRGVKGDGIIRATLGPNMLVHWQGKDIIGKLDKDKIVKKVEDLSVFINKGEKQKGWTKDTFLAIQKKQPAKGVFTIEIASSIESQSITGQGSHGATGRGMFLGAEQGIEAMLDMTAAVLDIVPGGQAIAPVATTAALGIAIKNQRWISAGLSVVALLPFAIGDAIKAAYPWINMGVKGIKTGSMGRRKLRALSSAIENITKEWKKMGEQKFKSEANKVLSTAGFVEKGEESSSKLVDLMYTAVDSKIIEWESVLEKVKV